MSERTILIKGERVFDERIGSGTVQPGALLERTSANLVKVHATAGGNAEKLFAVEDENQGKEISDNYADATRVFFRNCQRGEQVYAYLKDGQTSAIGMILESAGDGSLREHGIDSEGDYLMLAPVAVALEVVAASGSNARVLVEIL